MNRPTSEVGTKLRRHRVVEKAAGPASRTNKEK